MSASAIVVATPSSARTTVSVAVQLSITPSRSVIAAGRVAVDGDWAGISSVWVSPDHRRQGLGAVVRAARLGWAAERGATTAYLQVRGDNPSALTLYDRLGFATHHAYRYLAADRTV
ncbi:MAG: GNAT family N-acetyltransferase [Nocardioidaceae bacterium]